MSGQPSGRTSNPDSKGASANSVRRAERPVFVELLPPCNNACPAGENIQAWLSHAETGNYERAWRVLTEDNPLPACLGRICYHRCESKCNRAEIDGAVAISAVERFLGDEAIKRGWKFDRPASDSGKRVLVVGAGPSGLSAAYHLRRLGHSVVLQDAGGKAGGMMRFGIPKYRLPRDVLDAEIERIVDTGVELILNSKVDNIRNALTAGKFDAVFLAVGAHIGRRAHVPAGDAARIVDAISVLRSMEGEDKPLLGRKVVVYGGGNSALDAARTAKRLGASESVIVYRRTRAKMPAHDFEVEEALEEGVTIRWLSTITRLDDDKLTIEKMELDETGFPRPTGRFETLESDSVILALGQDADLALLDGVEGFTTKDGAVEVGPNMMTGAEGIFAGGDMVPSERTVTAAIGHGKKAARHIDAWLSGKTYETPAKRQAASIDKLNTWYYTDAPMTTRSILDAVHRRTTFDEVVSGLDESQVLFEARRCLSCGNCFACDNCYGMCPESAVIKLEAGQRFEFDYDACNGCGICAEECPCGAIAMAAETT